MEKFKIVQNNKTSFVRSIRFDTKLADKLSVISKASGTSFNKLVIKCICYALENM